MACSLRPLTIPGPAWPGLLAANEAATGLSERMTDLRRLLADIAEPTADAATDLPVDLLDALAAWTARDHAAH